MSFRLVVLLASFLVTGCAAATQAGEPAEPAPEGITSEEFEALYEARTDSARMRFTAADVAFVTGMIGHHAQALVMSSLVPDRATSPSIKTLSQRIINAQQDEIATMERWLRDRDQPVPEIHIQGTTLHVMGAEHAHAMPGMATAEQLAELEAARGALFERLFLTLMIEHHRGAVTMVHELFATDGAAQDTEIFKLASDIQVDQITEINRMESMLAAYR